MIQNTSRSNGRRKYRKAFIYVKKNFLAVVSIGVALAIVLTILTGFGASSGANIDVTGLNEGEASLETNPWAQSGNYKDIGNVDVEIYQTSYTKTEDTPPVLPVTEKENEEPTYYIELTDDEIWMLATLVYLEGGIESIECQKAIASVVINRMTLWNMSLEEVIYEKNQFSPAHLIEDSCPDDIQIGLVHEIIMNGVTLPEYVCYFRADYYHNWDGMNDYCKFDRTYFSYSDQDYHKYEEKIDDEI